MKKARFDEISAGRRKFEVRISPSYRCTIFLIGPLTTHNTLVRTSKAYISRTGPSKVRRKPQGVPLGVRPTEKKNCRNWVFFRSGGFRMRPTTSQRPFVRARNAYFAREGPWKIGYIGKLPISMNRLWNQCSIQIRCFFDLGVFACPEYAPALHRNVGMTDNFRENGERRIEKLQL